MSRLHQIKAAQIAAAEEAGEAHPYKKPEAIKPVLVKHESSKPSGRMAQIKAAQLAEFEKTGVNPYQNVGSTDAKPAASLKKLADYQAAMDVDIGKLANQKDIADKVRLKQALLPEYLPFVDDYVKQGDNYPNSVAVQVMIWLLDVGEIEHGLNLALLLIEQKQIMPARFDRDMRTFLCDFIYDWANEMLKAEHSASPYLDIVIAASEKDNWDVHPLCFSKNYSMLAKHKERTEDYKEALALCEKAEAVNPEKAGVKGMKERLQKRLAE